MISARWRMVTAVPVPTLRWRSSSYEVRANTTASARSSTWQELAVRCTRPPDRYLWRSRSLCVVDFAEECRKYVGCRGFVVVVGAVQVGRHENGAAHSVLAPVRFGEFHRRDLRDGVAFMVRFGGTGEECRFRHRLWDSGRVGGRGAEHDRALDVADARRLDHIRGNQQIRRGGTSAGVARCAPSPPTLAAASTTTSGRTSATNRSVSSWRERSTVSRSTVISTPIGSRSRRRTTAEPTIPRWPATHTRLLVRSYRKPLTNQAPQSARGPRDCRSPGR